MRWGRHFGWRRCINQSESATERYGPGSGRRCWRIASLLAKLKGEDAEKYLSTRKPCWMILQEILEEFVKKKKEK